MCNKGYLTLEVSKDGPATGSGFTLEKFYFNRCCACVRDGQMKVTMGPIDSLLTVYVVKMKHLMRYGFV